MGKMRNRIQKLPQSFGHHLKDLAYLVLKSFPRKLLWLSRWTLRTAQSRRRRLPSTLPKNFSLDDASIVYINLAKRSDRDLQIRSEFERLGLIDVARFEAIEDENGGLGCALSHEACLTGSLRNRASVTIICEDDLEFLAPRQKIEALIQEFLLDSRLDVLCLGNAVIETPVKISDRLSISNTVQTTSCYVLKPRSIPHILNSARKSAARLGAGRQYSRSAFDQVWKSDQQWRLVFAVPNTPVAKQRPSFSDIEKRDVRYQA